MTTPQPPSGRHHPDRAAAIPVATWVPTRPAGVAGRHRAGLAARVARALTNGGAR